MAIKSPERLNFKVRIFEPEKAELDPLLKKIANVIKNEYPCEAIQFKSPLAERQFFRLASKVLQTGNLELYRDAILQLFEG